MRWSPDSSPLWQTMADARASCHQAWKIPRKLGMTRLNWGLTAGLAILVVLLSGASGWASQATPDASPVALSATIEATSTATLEFPAGIRIESSLDIEEPGKDSWLELVYRIGDNETYHLASLPASLVPEKGALTATGWLDLQAQYVPPGLPITYHWQLASTGGVIAVSSDETTLWYDDRHDWRHAIGDYVSMHWYDLEPEFANEILASAEDTVRELEHRFGLTTSSMFELWVYPSQDAFLDALVPNSREALAAATYPDFGLTLAVVPDGSEAEIGRVIPHEVTHLVLFEATDSPFSTVPLWFNEGLATQIQVGGTDGYLPMVTRALDEGTLYSLRSIDVTFPYTAYEATLAYASSWSALEYIEATWGDAGISNLIAAYAAGQAWDDAMIAGLQVTMDEFEQGWRAWIADQALDEAA